jgi:hypothetical protein
VVWKWGSRLGKKCYSRPVPLVRWLRVR